MSACVRHLACAAKTKWHTVGRTGQDEERNKTSEKLLRPLASCDCDSDSAMNGEDRRRSRQNAKAHDLNQLKFQIKFEKQIYLIESICLIRSIRWDCLVWMNGID